MADFFESSQRLRPAGGLGWNDLVRHCPSRRLGFNCPAATARAGLSCLRRPVDWRWDSTVSMLGIVSGPPSRLCTNKGLVRKDGHVLGLIGWRLSKS